MSDDVEEFVFAGALARRDETACAALWGSAGIVVADAFEIAFTDRRDLERFLAQAGPVYDHLDVFRIEPHILGQVELTQSITRVTVRYLFHDSSGAHLTDGDFEYVLRRDRNGVRRYVGVNISAEPKLAALARHRGFH